VIRFKLNEQLARYLRDHPNAAKLEANYTPAAYRRPRNVFVRDRLSERDIAALVAAFKASVPKHVLAKRYGIGLKSVKKLLHEEGVKRRLRHDIQQ